MAVKLMDEILLILWQWRAHDWVHEVFVVHELATDKELFKLVIRSTPMTGGRLSLTVEAV
jgi:hypothetical protein